jgi:peptide/nickel transport system permease protein
MIEVRRFRRHYLRSVTALAGTAIVAFCMLIAATASWVAPHNPYDLQAFSLADSLKPPAWREGGSSKFLLGTDDQGRDILSMIIFGLRTSFIISFSAVGIAFLVGSVLGLLAGYFGGWWDAAISRVCDIMLSFPAFLIALLLLGLLKQRGAVPVVIAIAATFWVRYARLIRGNVLSEKTREYVDAARSLGAGHLRIIFRHLLPNSVSILFVIAAVDLAMVIVLESTLSFLGVGVPLTMPSLGMLIASGYNFLYMGIWWIVIYPGFVLALLVFSINLLGDWLREELNPKMRG